MSYLLDALKKAEQERKQDQGDKVMTPAVVSAPSSIPAAFIWVAVGLVLITGIKMFWPAANDGEYINEQANQGEVRQPMTQGATQAIAATQNQGAAQKANDLHGQSNQAPSNEVSVLPVKELMELDEKTLSKIPSISLESHIYSPVSDYRSVIINGNSYSENALLSAGVVLSEITKDGVTIMVGQQPVHLPKGITWVSTKHAQ